MLLFRFPVLGVLFVSFHPSRFRSHSRSTGASLPFRILSSASLPGFSACFPLPFVRFFSGLFCLHSAFFRLRLPASDYSAFCPFFSLLPVSPGSGSIGASFLVRKGLFPCLPSDSGTQLPAIPFSVRRFASQWLPLRLSLLPCGFWPFPLGFRFRFWLLGFETYP